MQINSIDVLKVLASQIIVFHHFFLYGPLSRSLAKSVPELSQFLTGYGSYAVQIFLVIGGFLAIQVIPKALIELGLLKVILNRYLRLAPAYIAALGVTMIVAYFTRFWMNEEYVGLSETWSQIIAHILLIHGITGFESISAGVWYVAIDWQLYSFIAIYIFFFRASLISLLFLGILALGSLLLFNRIESLENYFIYFLGAYSVGIFAQRASNRSQSNSSNLWLFLSVCALVSLAFMVQPWLRNIVVIVTGLILYCYGNRSFEFPNRWIQRGMLWLSRRSYSLFLIHFSVILLINSVIVTKEIELENLALFMLFLGWLLSLLLSHNLYEFVEQPFRKLQFKKFK